jgi:hypothetical protein
MRRFHGNETVEPGLYLNLRQLAFESVDEARPLPGAATDVFRRVPMLLLFIAAPLLGLVYVIFLPLIGFAMVTWLVGGKAARAAADTARTAARVLKPGWEPSLAFLSRSRPTTHAPEGTDEWAKNVEKKLETPNDDAS